MRMPGMDGIETLEQIRASGSQVAVIIMTGYGDPHNIIIKMFQCSCYRQGKFNLLQVVDLINLKVTKIGQVQYNV
jgi:two-component system response regulator (stage 0 sporulation protein F)